VVYDLRVDFSFGIVTGGGCDERISAIIASIEALKIPNYEVLIVGSTKLSGNNISVINFDEEIKKAWITRKKNLITSYAKYENVVYLHDYIVFDPDWYQGFLVFGNQFDAVICRIKNLDGTRYRDWCLWNRNYSIMDWIVYPNRTLIPYELLKVKSHLYFSGAFWVAKKSFMERFPLNEELVAGEAEDVEWSIRVQDATQLQFNENSGVRFLKNNLVVFQDPGRIRVWLISMFLTTSLGKIDRLYKALPIPLEDFLYRQLGNVSKLSHRIKSWKRAFSKN
jgi:hypothetical protein